MASKQFPFTDEELLRFEQQRGTLPPPEYIGTEWDSDNPPAVDGKSAPVTYSRAQEAMRVAREAHHDPA